MRFLAPASSSATSTSRLDTSPGIAPKIDRAQDTSERTGRNHSGTSSLMQEMGAAAAYAKVQKTSQQVAAGDPGACLIVLLFPARRLCCPRTSTSVSLLVSTKSQNTCTLLVWSLGCLSDPVNPVDFVCISFCVRLVQLVQATAVLVPRYLRYGTAVVSSRIARVPY